MSFVHNINKEIKGIINKEKYFIVNLIFVFTKINDIKSIKTGKKHAAIYIKYSKYIGSIFNLLDRHNWANSPINHINNKLKSIINIWCN